MGYILCDNMGTQSVNHSSGLLKESQIYMKDTSQNQKITKKMCRMTELSIAVTKRPEEQVRKEGLFLLVLPKVLAHKHMSLLFMGLW